MKLSEVIKNIELEKINEFDAEREVDGVYIGDLLSLVMSRANKDNIWITIQTHLNIIAVASLIELSAIIVAEGMDIDTDTIEKAKALDIPILRTSLSAYDLACKLNELGI